MQKFDARQTIYRGLLSRLSLSTNPEGDNLLLSANAEVTPLFELKAASPISRVVNVGPSVVNNAETGLNRAPITIGANTPNITSGTLTFPSTPGTVTASPGNNATFSMGANEYIKCLVYLDASDNLNLIFGTSNAVEATATVPAPPSGTIPIGHITVQTVSGNVQNIANAKIYQYAGASGASSDGGGGTLSPAPGYKFLASESFDSVRGSSDDTTDTSITTATYDAGKKLYKVLCDKTRTVNTSSGTALTINLAAGFTVAVGDIVYATSGARSGQWRKIATVTNQTTFVLDSAFTGGNASNGDTLMLSQAIYTKDLVNFGSATELTRPRDFYAAENVLQLLVDYADSLTSGDDVADFVSTARVSVSACNSGLQADTGAPASNLYTSTLYTRPTAPGTISDYILGSNTNTQRLFLIFFANPANASVVSTCNLLQYECNFYSEAAAINGGILDSAYGISDASGTPYNMTVSTVTGLTRCDLSWSFNPAADPGGVSSQMDIKVNGQDVPKFVSSAVTPATQLSYTLSTDANGLNRRVIFNKDLSIEPVDIKIVRRQGMYDASFTQSAKLLGMFDAIVGTSAQVTAGTATHSSLQAAHDAVASGANILVLNNVTLNGNTTLSKRVLIVGKGGASVLSGNLTVASGAAGSIIEWLKISGNITFNSGADRCFMTRCYQASGNSFSNDPANAENVIDVLVE